MHFLFIHSAKKFIDHIYSSRIFLNKADALEFGGINLKKIIIALLVIGFVLSNLAGAVPGKGKGVGIGNGADEDFVPPGQGGTAPGQDGSTPGHDGSAPGKEGTPPGHDVDWIPDV